MIISSIIVLFLLHPSLTGMSMGLFNCYEIDSGEYWLFKDLSVRCWHGSHNSWAFGLGIPMIFFWVFGLPLVGFILVRKNRKRLDDETVMFRYRILYQGYKKEAYYWEFVNVFRKVSVVMINIFLGIYPPIYKTFVATLTLAIILRQQEQIQPYKIKIMNECEFRESTTSIVTLFGGMFFILESLPIVIVVILVLVIFFCNIWFFSLWLHLFFKNSRFTTLRILALFFGKISCLGKAYWNEEQKNQASNHDMDFVFGKYDPKETKYNKIEEESKDQSFAGYDAPHDNIINDLSAGDSNTGSLKSKEKAAEKAKLAAKKAAIEAEEAEATSKPKKKKKKRIIKKRRVKKNKAGEKDANNPEYDQMEENEDLEQAINEEMDAMEMGKNLSDEEIEGNVEEEPKKSTRRGKKKSARKKKSSRKKGESAREKGPSSKEKEPETKGGSARKKGESSRKKGESARRNEEQAKSKEDTNRKKRSARSKGEKSGRKKEKTPRDDHESADSEAGEV